MNELVRRIAFEIQDDGISRLKAQRIVAAVLGALDHGDQIGKALVVQPLAQQSRRDGDQRL